MLKLKRGSNGSVLKDKASLVFRSYQLKHMHLLWTLHLFDFYYQFASDAEISYVKEDLSNLMPTHVTEVTRAL